MKKKLTVTVGISALNEETNIGTMLRAVLAQRGDNFVLKEIMVISDGSTDNTVGKVREIKDKRITVIVGKKREGMNTRLNYLFAHFQSDVLIKMDADILPQNESVISLLISPFLENPRVAYTSGRLVPVKPTTFIEKCINTSRFVWDNVRDELKNGNSIYSCAGGIYALSKSFARTATYPPDLWTDLGYPYFLCLTHNLLFVSVKAARIYFHPPTTVRDHINQLNRYEGEIDPLKKYVSQKLLEKEYRIPKPMLYKYMFLSLLRYPIYTISLFFINTYGRLTYRYSKRNRAANWTMIRTSKRTFT